MIQHTDFGGVGESIHFVHANGYPPACYFPLLAQFKTSYHVFAMHLRPLWPDANPKQIKDWHPLTNDFMCHIKENSSSPVIAIGHSVGAIVALRAAIAFPDYFKALILIDPVLFLPNIILIWNLARMLGLGHKVHPLIPGALKRRRIFNDLDLLFESYRQKKIFRYFDDTSLWAYIRGITVPSRVSGYELAYSPEWEVQIYDSGVSKDMDIWKNLSSLKVPTIILRGAETDTFLPQTAKRIKQLSPQIRIVTIEKSTHLVPLEKPKETFESIHSFLKEIL